jgi:hypothetical protein
LARVHAARASPRVRPLAALAHLPTARDDRRSTPADQRCNLLLQKAIRVFLAATPHPNPAKVPNANARAGVGSDRSPNPVVPESPPVSSLVPHHQCSGRPRRWRWLRRRPRRRDSPGPEAGRTGLALSVVAVIPVPVVGLPPTRVPLIAGAPVISGRRSRDRLGPGAASQSERGQSQPANHQHPCRPLHSRHLPRISRRPDSTQAAVSPKPPGAQEAAPRLAMLCDQSTGSRGYWPIAWPPG